VLIYDADLARDLPAARLAFLYRITPSEQRVCESLFRTGSVDGVADEICLSRNTVRSHLKRIFAKFGVATQAQLMQKLANSVSMPEGPDDAEKTG
jgi:DNA-binding CsgD family transcriptional regulator